MRLPTTTVMVQVFFFFGFVSLWLLAFPKAKIVVVSEEICECDSHTVHKLSQRRLTAVWLTPRESDCSRLHSKVFSDWLPSYIKATRPVLEIFKMVWYFPDSPLTHTHTYIYIYIAWPETNFVKLNVALTDGMPTVIQEILYGGIHKLWMTDLNVIRASESGRFCFKTYEPKSCAPVRLDNNFYKTEAQYF